MFKFTKTVFVTAFFTLIRGQLVPALCYVSSLHIAHTGEFDR